MNTARRFINDILNILTYILMHIFLKKKIFLKCYVCIYIYACMHAVCILHTHRQFNRYTIHICGIIQWTDSGLPFDRCPGALAGTWSSGFGPQHQVVGKLDIFRHGYKVAKRHGPALMAVWFRRLSCHLEAL